MAYFRRRDWFFGVLMVLLLSLYFIFDVSIYSVGWSERAGIFALIFVLYQSVVQLPGIGDELEKQKEINEKLNDQLTELRDKIKYRN